MGSCPYMTIDINIANFKNFRQISFVQFGLVCHNHTCMQNVTFFLSARNVLGSLRGKGVIEPCFGVVEWSVNTSLRSVVLKLSLSVMVKIEVHT